ncbi:hypothetical protein [Nocardia rhizosphaerihabitans]|uniref:DUF8176 domain-containing protein n=1 Tax=Nocardia rhizosphaerihabitans TaxID=1691570 RepID=A0ABQ2K764_9NOCA|nr:hypothetical protein [Nocardia rhizosphaerihabitans]GGN69389.1 hypothetical protein GCM10011610_07560 [Nocardia rhizosphaerihabitans]
MLKSYNELSRWYSALEPETDAADPARQDTADPAAGEDDGLDRYSQRPERAPSADQAAEPAGPELFTAAGDHSDRTTGVDTDRRDTDYGFATGYDNSAYGAQPYPAEPEPEPEPAPPAELAARRSEFTGGWSDWVAEPAPGPDDDYDAELVQFPWPDAAADDYEEARVLQPSGALRAKTRRNRTWIVLVISVLVLVLAATGVFFLLFGRGGDNAEHAAPLHFVAGNLAAPQDPCPTERTETVVRSAEAGGTGSGPDAVLAFQYAYYVNRSGEQARAMVAPDADVSPAAVIQRGIDSIPVGTTHCVRITTVAVDRYTVEVTEFRPAGAPATYTKQSVRTALIGDRTLITGIAAG